MYFSHGATINWKLKPKQILLIDMKVLSYLPLFLLVAGCLVDTKIFAQTPNRPIPSDLAPYAFVEASTAPTGDYLLAPFFLFPNASYKPSLMILDSEGYIKWYMTRESGVMSNFNYFPNQNLYTFDHRASVWPSPGSFITLDANMELNDSISTVNGIDPDYHENRFLPNGHRLIDGKTDSIVDLSAYTFDGMPGSATTSIRAYVIQEFDQNNNLVFQWNSNEHVHPTESYETIYGYDVNDFDYCHGNAIEKDVDGNYLVSYRHLNSVHKISATDGHIMWRLGGKLSDFTFTNDPGFSGQHDIRVLANGNYTVFDNGNMSGPPEKSRAVEYALDTVNWTATRVWEYDYTPSFFAMAMGSHQTTASDLHMINYGLNRSTTLNTILVDDAGNTLSEIHFVDTVYTYRAYYHEQSIALPQFQITCIDSAGSYYLKAPSGFTKYLWSTDETSQTIEITTTGKYQVYVNYGAGMLASYPFEVTDINAPCGFNSIYERQRPESSEIIGYYDLSGRYVNRPVPNQIYIVKYADGTVRKRFIVE